MRQLNMDAVSPAGLELDLHQRPRRVNVFDPGGKMVPVGRLTVDMHQVRPHVSQWRSTRTHTPSVHRFTEVGSIAFDAGVKKVEITEKIVDKMHWRGDGKPRRAGLPAQSGRRSSPPRGPQLPALPPGR